LPATYRLFLAVLAALTINACDTIPARDDRGQDREDTPAEQSSVEVIPLEASDLGTEFEPQAEQQDPDQAIKEDLRDALDSLPPYRQSAYLDAAGGLIRTGRLEAAETLLDKTVVTGLAPILQARKRLLEAEIEFRRDDLDRALRDVNRGLRTGNIDPTYISRGLDLKGRIELLKGRPLEAARAWIRRDSYLSDTRAIGDNNSRIWFALGHLNELELQVASQGGADETLRGWLDLAILFLEFGGDSQGLRTAVTQWSNANRGHPAADFAAAALGPERAPGVRQVALLLPMSSNFGAAARSVYNGFEAAQQNDSDPRRPQLLFYDIGGEPALAGNYVGVAASEGADVIVGPLGKAAVNALLESRQPPKPMVMLGSESTDRPLPPGAYQFDLAPEPEARRVAEFMYVSGHRRVGALYPDDEWGQRVFDAFSEHWRALGGTLAEARAYQPDADDHTAVLKNLFNLTESETRKALIGSASGLSLDFDPRRRQDMDAIFMAARPDEARLLKPQINFFQGLDLPVYSTSHVYTGKPDAVKDTDLDGIVFPAMPWVLRDTARMNQLKAMLADDGFSGVSSELFAFGYDAYHLALLAPATGATGRTTQIPGLTADLIIGDNGRIQRRPGWARFRDGVPIKIWE
jgi:outer membrane PBP1 activator LpoA protein